MLNVKQLDKIRKMYSNFYGYKIKVEINIEFIYVTVTYMDSHWVDRLTIVELITSSNPYDYFASFVDKTCITVGHNK